MSIKISELPSAEAVNNGDYLAIVQDGTTKKATASMLSADIATTINSSSTNNTAAGAKAVYDYAAPKKHDSTAQTYGVGTDEKYGHVMLVDDLNSSSLQAGKALSSHQGYVIKGLLDAKQDIINGYNKIDADFVDDTTSENKFITEEQIQEIEELKAENEALLDQIPTATATGYNINVQDSSNLPLKDFALGGNAVQSGTPTPDSPQNINVVTGDNTVKVVGKNLWNIAEKEFSSQSHLTSSRNFNNNSYTFTSTSSGYAFAISTIKLKAGTYTISYNRLAGTSGDVQFIVGQNLYRTLTIADETTVTIRAFIPNASTNESFTIQLQIEKNSTATPFEPYTSQTQLISLGSIELAKIGDYTDRIFKAVQGNSIYDSLDSTTKASLTVGSWYKQRNIGKGIFNGSGGWVKSTAFPGNYYLTNALPNGIQNNPNNICNFTNTFLSNENQLSSNDNCILIGAGTNSTLNFKVSSIATLDAFKTFLNNTNLVINYVLATPTYTEITDTTLIGQLENILAMHTNKNVTNAWIEPTGTNAQAGMVLVYRQDLATLISAS